MFPLHFAVRLIPRQRGRCWSSSARRDTDFTHAVIGGGVVGLAIARRLQHRDGARVVLVEKNGMVGTETSSRNSEIIHAGIYYGPDTLKTKLCVQGKKQLYDLCAKHGIPHRNCGKWVVAQSDDQLHRLQGVHDFAKSIDVPTQFISKGEAQSREPTVRAESGALESPTTGIVDSHSLMQFLYGDFEESGGTTALASTVSRARRVSHGGLDWRIWTAPTNSLHRGAAAEESDDEDFSISAENVINSAGLHAVAIHNMVLPERGHRTPYYAKGTYYSYSKSSPRPSTLIYPAPVPGHAGLGTHLTLDLAGRVRFGPDVEWVDSPYDLAPNSDPLRFQAALEDIKAYLPSLDTDAVALDYCGIRPKLGRSGAQHTGKGEFLDFHIEEDVSGFVNLLGIESPGLTASLAIADYVHDLLHNR